MTKLNAFIGFKCTQEQKDFFDLNGGSEYVRNLLDLKMASKYQEETIEEIVLRYLSAHLPNGLNTSPVCIREDAQQQAKQAMSVLFA
ncbi:MAG: hypothetical protein K0Q77_108 [Anaerosporomusa subterranea]|jgi:hypothetical protein|nr:hypothetical protein [Anaerosporomusa subterranea]